MLWAHKGFEAMSILFTSDLDRTLIFSERTKLKDEEYVCIEQLDGRDMSYMSVNTYRLLKEVQQYIQFVPVTTRSLKQYERITVFSQDLKPEIAIVANGGTILRNGVVDTTWQQIVAQKMHNLPLKREHLRQHFQQQFTASYIGNVHEVDDLFFVLIVDVQTVNLEEINNFNNELENIGWTSSLQGKKLYVLPQFLTKGAAVQYIKAEQTYDWHVAAGDSQLDLSMLHVADTRLIPSHAELAHMLHMHQMPITDFNSSHFSDYSLRRIVDQIKVSRGI